MTKIRWVSILIHYPNLPCGFIWFGIIGWNPLYGLALGILTAVIQGFIRAKRIFSDYLLLKEIRWVPRGADVPGNPVNLLQPSADPSADRWRSEQLRLKYLQMLCSIEEADFPGSLAASEAMFIISRETERLKKKSEQQGFYIPLYLAIIGVPIWIVVSLIR